MKSTECWLILLPIIGLMSSLNVCFQLYSKALIKVPTGYYDNTKAYYNPEETEVDILDENDAIFSEKDVLSEPYLEVTPGPKNQPTVALVNSQTVIPDQSELDEVDENSLKKGHLEIKIDKDNEELTEVVEDDPSPKTLPLEAATPTATTTTPLITTVDNHLRPQSFAKAELENTTQYGQNTERVVDKTLHQGQSSSAKSLSDTISKTRLKNSSLSDLSISNSSGLTSEVTKHLSTVGVALLNYSTAPDANSLVSKHNVSNSVSGIRSNGDLPLSNTTGQNPFRNSSTQNLNISNQATPTVKFLQTVKNTSKASDGILSMNTLSGTVNQTETNQSSTQRLNTSHQDSLGINTTSNTSIQDGLAINTTLKTPAQDGLGINKQPSAGSAFNSSKSIQDSKNLSLSHGKDNSTTTTSNSDSIFNTKIVPSNSSISNSAQSGTTNLSQPGSVISNLNQPILNSSENGLGTTSLGQSTTKTTNLKQSGVSSANMDQSSFSTAIVDQSGLSPANMDQNVDQLGLGSTKLGQSSFSFPNGSTVILSKEPGRTLDQVVALEKPVEDLDNVLKRVPERLKTIEELDKRLNTLRNTTGHRKMEIAGRIQSVNRLSNVKNYPVQSKMVVGITNNYSPRSEIGTVSPYPRFKSAVESGRLYDLENHRLQNLRVTPSPAKRLNNFRRMNILHDPSLKTSENKETGRRSKASQRLASFIKTMKQLFKEPETAEDIMGWEAWSQCSRTCGKRAFRTRQRKCGRLVQSDFDVACPEPRVQTQKCSEVSCSRKSRKDKLRDFLKMSNEDDARLNDHPGANNDQNTIDQMFSKNLDNPRVDLASDAVDKSLKFNEEEKDDSANDNPSENYEQEDNDDNSSENDVLSPSNAPKPYLYTVWGSWSSCTRTCGQRSYAFRKRYCINAVNGEIKRHCQRPTILAKKCTVNPCPVNGGLSDWSEWSSCSDSCGIMERHRSCTNPKPAYGGKECRKLPVQMRMCGTCETQKVIAVKKLASYSPKFLCGFDPCQRVGCIADKGAICVTDFECNPTFFDDEGNVLRGCKENANLFLRPLAQKSCSFNPCTFTKCDVKETKCLVDTKCRPFFVDNMGQKINCKGSNVLQISSELICGFNPCKITTCTVDPDAKCVTDYRCNPIFVNSEGKRILGCTEDEAEEAERFTTRSSSADTKTTAEPMTRDQTLRAKNRYVDHDGLAEKYHEEQSAKKTIKEKISKTNYKLATIKLLENILKRRLHDKNIEDSERTNTASKKRRKKKIFKDSFQDAGETNSSEKAFKLQYLSENTPRNSKSRADLKNSRKYDKGMTNVSSNDVKVDSKSDKKQDSSPTSGKIVVLKTVHRSDTETTEIAEPPSSGHEDPSSEKNHKLTRVHSPLEEDIVSRTNPGQAVRLLETPEHSKTWTDAVDYIENDSNETPVSGTMQKNETKKMQNKKEGSSTNVDSFIIDEFEKKKKEDVDRFIMNVLKKKEKDKVDNFIMNEFKKKKKEENPDLHSLMPFNTERYHGDENNHKHGARFLMVVNNHRSRHNNANNSNNNHNSNNNTYTYNNSNTIINNNTNNNNTYTYSDNTYNNNDDKHNNSINSNSINNNDINININNNNSNYNSIVNFNSTNKSNSYSNNKTKDNSIVDFGNANSNNKYDDEDNNNNNNNNSNNNNNNSSNDNNNNNKNATYSSSENHTIHYNVDMPVLKIMDTENNSGSSAKPNTKSSDKSETKSEDPFVYPWENYLAGLSNVNGAPVSFDDTDENMSSGNTPSSMDYHDVDDDFQDFDIDELATDDQSEKGTSAESEENKRIAADEDSKSNEEERDWKDVKDKDSHLNPSNDLSIQIPLYDMNEASSALANIDSQESQGSSSKEVVKGILTPADKSKTAQKNDAESFKTPVEYSPPKPTILAAENLQDEQKASPGLNVQSLQQNNTQNAQEDLKDLPKFSNQSHPQIDPENQDKVNELSIAAIQTSPDAKPLLDIPLARQSNVTSKNLNSKVLNEMLLKVVENEVSKLKAQGLLKDPSEAEANKNQEKEGAEMTYGKEGAILDQDKNASNLPVFNDDNSNVHEGDQQKHEEYHQGDRNQDSHDDNQYLHDDSHEETNDNLQGKADDVDDASLKEIDDFLKQDSAGVGVVDRDRETTGHEKNSNVLNENEGTIQSTNNYKISLAKDLGNSEFGVNKLSEDNNGIAVHHQKDSEPELEDTYSPALNDEIKELGLNEYYVKDGFESRKTKGSEVEDGKLRHILHTNRKSQAATMGEGGVAKNNHGGILPVKFPKSHTGTSLVPASSQTSLRKHNSDGDEIERGPSRHRVDSTMERSRTLNNRREKTEHSHELLDDGDLQNESVDSRTRNLAKYLDRLGHYIGNMDGSLLASGLKAKHRAEVEQDGDLEKALVFNAKDDGDESDNIDESLEQDIRKDRVFGKRKMLKDHDKLNRNGLITLPASEDHAEEIPEIRKRRVRKHLKKSRRIPSRKTKA